MRYHFNYWSNAFIRSTVLLFSLFFLLLPLIAQQPRLVLPVGHTGPLLTAEFNRDGKYAVTVSNDGTAMLWETSTGKLLEDFRAYGDASAMMVTGARFSDDGKLLFIFYEGTHFICYNTETGKKFNPAVPYQTLSEVMDAPQGWALEHIMHLFTKDSKRYLYVTFTDMGKPTIYDLRTGKAGLKLKEQQGQVIAASFSDDDKRIVTLGIDSVIRIWNAQTGQLIKRIDAPGFNYTSVAFMPGDKTLACITDKDELHLIDIAAGKLVTKIVNSPMTSIQFSPGKNFLLTFSGARSVEYFDEDSIPYSVTLYDTVAALDLHTGENRYEITNLDFLKDESMLDLFSPDGNKIILPGKENIIAIRETRTGRLLYELDPGNAQFRTLGFDRAGKKIITLLSDNSIHTWNAENGTLTGKLNPDGDSLFGVAFNSDGDKVIGAAGTKAIIWDASSGDQIAELKGHSNIILSAGLSKDNTTLMLEMENVVKSYDLINGKIGIGVNRYDSNYIFRSHFKIYQDIFSPDSVFMTCNYGVNLLSICKCSIVDDGGEKIRIPGDVVMQLNSFETINDVQFSPDSRNLVVTYENSRVSVYDLASKKQRYTFIAIDSLDYLVQNNSGYYKGTKGAARELHYVTKDLDLISFEQLDVKYNRPDKILASMNYPDKLLAQAYQNAYQKRIKKLGIDTNSFRKELNVPVTDIVNRNEITNQRNEQQLSLHISSNDRVSKLDRFNIWINEVPLFGMKGLNIRKRNRNNFDTSLVVLLSNGINRIETSVINSNGIESYRKPLLVNYTTTVTSIPKVYFIGIGINNFADSSNDLKWCVQDIRDLVKMMQAKYRDRLIILDTLFNERVTTATVKSLKQKLFNTGINDHVIVSYSGHGLLSKDLDYYLSSYNVNFKKPEQGGIRYEEFESLLDSIPARKKILFLDACHSGELDKDELKKIDASANSLAQQHTRPISGHRGTEVTLLDDSSGNVGLKNSFELMQSLFVNVGKGTGATIISASGGVQFAQERSELGHGVFTYSLIEAMEKFPTIKISSLKKYIGDRVFELTNGLQVPTTRNEPVATDWDIW